MSDSEKKKYEKAKRIFENYNRMYVDIKMLENSIKFYEENIHKEMDSDIYSLSVSHASENTGSFNANVSTDKIPNIVERMGQISKEYADKIVSMKYKLNVYKQAINSVDILVSRISKTKEIIIRQHYMDDRRKPFSRIAEAVNLTETRVKQLAREVIEEYCQRAIINYDMVIELL